MSSELSTLATAVLLALFAGAGSKGGGSSSSGDGAGGEEAAFAEARARMVETQIVARGVRDPRVLDAMRAVPRHRFVPEHLRDAAYDDSPLPIDFGQTISQPYIVAAMTEALRPAPGDVVLDVGTGSGYQAAVLARLVKRVISIEILAPLAERARATLAELGVDNVEVRVGDGWQGVPAGAPYAGILVAAAPDVVPPALLEQLAVGARLVIPVGDSYDQELRIVTRTARGYETETLFGVRFVPLVPGEDER